MAQKSFNLSTYFRAVIKGITLKVVKLSIPLKNRALKRNADVGFDKGYTFAYYQHFDLFQKQKNTPVVYLFSYYFYLTLEDRNIVQPKIKIAGIQLISTTIKRTFYINGWYGGVFRI